MIPRLLLAACVFSVISLQAKDETTTAPAKAKVVQATAADDLKALAGQTATVEGKVNRIGSTKDNTLTFINMAPGANSFVAIVFKSGLAKFPDGLDKYKDQTIRVTGKVTLYKQTTPEIIINGPDQVEIVAAAAAAATPKDGG